jgi:general secretion pathway protein E/type IV pilus assembly protein PilB
MAQRLVRRICARCKEPYTPDLRGLRTLGFDPDALAGMRLEHGKGCPYCGTTGFRGRMGIFEIFTVNEELQRLIYESATAHVLRNRARELGMRTMRDDGIRKVLAGQTTIEEVASTTIGDEN